MAGFETTTNLLGNGLVVLLRPPGAAAALRADPDLAPAYVEEMLRYDSPVQLTTAASTGSRCAAAGVDLPAGSMIAAAARRRQPGPAPVRRPGTLRPGPRRPHRRCPSAPAPHYCLGAALARLEAQVALPAAAAPPARAGPGRAAPAPDPADPARLRDLPVTLGTPAVVERGAPAGVRPGTP